MADFFSTIGNVLGNLTGINQQNAASAAQKQSASQQQLQNVYGAAGANVYGNLEQQGQQQSSIYGSNILNLLNSFGSMSGLGNNTLNTRQPSGLANQGNLASNLNSGGRLTPTQINQGQGTGALAVGQPQGQSGQPDPSSPYALDSNQQEQLNQAMAGLANAHREAVSSFTQQMAQHGISDPRALQVGTEQLDEHFSALQAEQQTKFYEQAKKDKLTAMQALINQLTQYGQQGVQEQEAAGSGYLGLASGAQAAANANQSNALQQEQLSQEQLGGLLQLAGFGLGGGFGGAPNPAIDNFAGPATVTPVNGIYPTA